MAALTAVQRLLVQGVKSLAEYVPVIVGGLSNAFQVVALKDANVSNWVEVPLPAPPVISVRRPMRDLPSVAAMHLERRAATVRERYGGQALHGKTAP